MRHSRRARGRDPETGRYGEPALAFSRLAERRPGAALRELRRELERTGGNIARTAHALGVSRRQFYRLLYAIPGAWEAVNRARRDAFLNAIANPAGLRQ